MIAVLTADLVASTKLDKSAYLAAMDTLHKLLESCHDSASVQYEIYRGDAFQVIYHKPEMAIRSAILLKLGMLGLNTKPIQMTQSVAIGDYQHLDKSPGKSNGAVFVESGRGLTDTSSGHISLHIPESLKNSDLSLSTLFLNHCVDQISQKQAQVGFHFIEQNAPKQSEIADILNMTRQNIATHLRRGAIDLILTYIMHYEGLFISQHKDAH